MKNTTKDKDIARIAIPMCRLSFAKIFKPEGFGGSEENKKYSANFIMDNEKHKEIIAKFKSAINELLKEAKVKVTADKICLKDGASLDYDGYGEGVTYVSASNSDKPSIVRLEAGRNALVSEEEAKEMGILYSGCYVDGVIRIWVQNNKWGKRANASLEVVRFRKHGEPFGSTVNVDDALDDIEIPEDELDSDMEDPMFG